jgi:hypothetical protein
VAIYCTRPCPHSTDKCRLGLGRPRRRIRHRHITRVCALRHRTVAVRPAEGDICRHTATTVRTGTCTSVIVRGPATNESTRRRITVDVTKVGPRRWMNVSGLRRRLDVVLTVLSWEKL